MKNSIWTHNPINGSIIGILLINPYLFDWSETPTASAKVMSSSKIKWCVLYNTDLAMNFMTFKQCQKLKFYGIMGDLQKWAWDNAVRQIVPDEIIFKN